MLRIFSISPFSKLCRLLPKHVRFSSNKPDRDVHTLAQVWQRSPLRRHYIPQQEAFVLSIHSQEKERQFQQHLSVRYPNKNVIYSPNKFDPKSSLFELYHWFYIFLMSSWIRRFADFANKTDLVDGSHRVANLIMAALRNRDFNSLAPLCADPRILDEHREQLFKLTKTQQMALNVTNEDLVGINGFLHNWNGLGYDEDGISRYFHNIRMAAQTATGKELEKPQIVYRIMLCYLLKKNSVYKAVRPFGYNPHGKDILTVKVPPGYGFRAPRYTVLSIDFCQDVLSINFPYPRVVQDLKIYDFHVHSF